MKTSIQPPLHLTYLNYRHASQDYLSLTVMLGFSLNHTGSLIDKTQTLTVTTESLASYTSQALTLDAGIGKPRGEFSVKVPYSALI